MELPSRGPLPRWVPFAILAAAAAYLGLRWNDIPLVWPSHWNAAGDVNGWSRRDLAGVFEPLGIGAGVLVVIEGAASFAGAAGRDVPAALRAAKATLARAMACSVALIFGFLAIALPLGPHVTPGMLAAGIILVVFAGLALGGSQMVYALAAAQREGYPRHAEGYRTFYYANRNDSRLWVPKRYGVGWTLNFAHPLAWPIMLLLIGIPLALTVVLRRG